MRINTVGGPGAGDWTLWTKGSMKRQRVLKEAWHAPQCEKPGTVENRVGGEWGRDWSSHTASHGRAKIGTQGHQSPTLCTVSHNLKCGLVGKTQRSRKTATLVCLKAGLQCRQCGAVT